MMHRKLALPFILAAVSFSAFAADPRPVTIEDFGQIRDVGEPALSIDGKYVAYVLDKQIYVAGVSGGEAPRPVTASSSSASDPYWSRDGDALYFLSNRSGTSQVWKLPLDTFGEAVQVTDVDRGIETLDFSPDETRLLLTYDDDAKKKPDSAQDSAASMPPEPFVIDRLQFKEDAGDGYLTARPSDHLYVYDVATRALTQVTSGRFSESDAAWSPDGERIVFVSSREDDPDVGYKTDLWTIGADPQGDEPLRLTASDDVKSSPQWTAFTASSAWPCFRPTAARRRS